MDPLTISVSAAQLAGVAANLSFWLYELVNNIKNIDSKIKDLCDEISRLSDLLKTVESTVQKCQPQALTLAHLDDNMWTQIDNALVDCKVNIEGLDRLLMRISGEYDPDAKNLARLLKKPSMNFRFSVNKDEVSDYTTKIYKCNCSMQTALAVVNVSLTFRMNVSQESLFQELATLKGLVKESLKAADKEQLTDEDPFAARQSRNLQSLAKAAQRFHSAASSTASTRLAPGDRGSLASNWGGSEGGELSEAERAHIERWNELATVEEDAEDSMTEGTGTLISSAPGDASTTLTTPDMDDVSHVSGRKSDTGFQAGVEEEEEEDSDDESDVELDFLRNFEELAHSSFVAENYSKAEQCLRMAVERSTGDASGTTDFKKLKMQLALCCCLQEKWDHAAGILEALPKSKTIANLPIFNLLQAISLAHTESSRFDDAYGICKTVLQGKKRILGKDSVEYYDSLCIFAFICEKKGNTLEAEAVRHSLPRGGQTAVRGEPRQWILDHPSLIGSIFSGAREVVVERESQVVREQTEETEKVDETEIKSPTSPASTSAPLASDGWETLVRNEPLDGSHRANEDEKKKALLEDMDTGKEFIVQTVPGVTFNPPTPYGITVSQPGVPQIQPPIDRGEDWGGDHFQAIRYPQIVRTPSVMEPASAPPSRSPPPEPSTSLLRTDFHPLRPISPKKHGTKLSIDLGMLGSRYGQLRDADSQNQSLTRSRSQHVPSFTNDDGNSSSLSRSHSQGHRVPDRESTDGTSTPALQTQGLGNNNPFRTQAPPDATSPTRAARRAFAYQQLIDKVQNAQTRTGTSAGASNSTTSLPLISKPPPIIDSIPDTDEAEEPYSTLEVLWAPPPVDTSSGRQPTTQYEYPYGTQQPASNPQYMQGYSMSSQSQGYNPYQQSYGGQYPPQEVYSPHGSSPYGPPGNNPYSSSNLPVNLFHGDVRRLNSSVDLTSADHQRSRWTVQKDIGNIGGMRPFGPSGPPQFLPMAKRHVNPDEIYIGVVAGYQACDSIILSKGGGNIAICKMPEPRSESVTRQSPMGMNKFLQKMNLGRKEASPLTNTSHFTVDIGDPRNWTDVLGIGATTGQCSNEFGEEREVRPGFLQESREIELEIANMVRQSQMLTHPETIASLRVEGLVYSLPDFLERLGWHLFTGVLAECSLMQHAKVIPHSAAIVQYYLDVGSLRLKPPAEPPLPVLVLNCDETLVDCVPYLLQVVSYDFVEISDAQTGYMAEGAGFKHARAEFAKLVDQQLKVTTRQLRRKIGVNIIDDIIRSCCKQFDEQILPRFENEGREWAVDIEIPQGVLQLQHGRLKFSNSEVNACFTPSIRMIKSMLEEMVIRSYNADHYIEYILVAGAYSKSPYLRRELNKAANQLRSRFPGSLNLLCAPTYEDICKMGAMAHAMNC